MSDSGPFGPVVNGTQIVFYQYRPSKPAAASFIVLFGLATLGHLIYFFPLWAWFFIPFILGGIGKLIHFGITSARPVSLSNIAYIIGEAFGYYGRFWASSEPDLGGPFILQNLLLLASPPFIAATIYMSFGRITIALKVQKEALISPRWLTKIYVLIDIGCVVSQIIGAVLPASGDPSSIALSKKVLLGGLITQVVALSFFILTCWHAHEQIKRRPDYELPVDPSISWQNHFRALELVTAILILRSVVRAIEFLQGEDGFVASHEVFIYVFDALLVFLIMLVFLILHPGRLIRSARQQSKSGFEIENNVLLESRG